MLIIHCRIRFFFPLPLRHNLDIHYKRHTRRWLPLEKYTRTCLNRIKTIHYMYFFYLKRVFQSQKAKNKLKNNYKHSLWSLEGPFPKQRRFNKQSQWRMLSFGEEVYSLGLNPRSVQADLLHDLFSELLIGQEGRIKCVPQTTLGHVIGLHSLPFPVTSAHV